MSDWPKPLAVPASAAEAFRGYVTDALELELKHLGAPLDSKHANDGDIIASRLALRIARGEAELAPAIACANTGDFVARKALGLLFLHLNRAKREIPSELADYIAANVFADAPKLGDDPKRSNAEFVDKGDRDKLIYFLIENGNHYVSQLRRSDPQLSRFEALGLTSSVTRPKHRHDNGEKTPCACGILSEALCSHGIRLTEKKVHEAYKRGQRLTE